MSWVHRCMITPAASAASARAICEALFGEAGANMFFVGLSPSGSLPVTHYVSTGLIAAEAAAMLDDANNVPVEHRAQAVAILANVIVSDQPPKDVFALNGLKMID